MPDLTVADPTSTPPARSEETKSIPWPQLGAEASKQVSGEALSVRLVEPGRARLETRFQRLAATVTAAEGLWLNSTAERPAGVEEAGRFRVLAHAVGRGEGVQKVIPRRGEVVVAEERVRWLRPGLTEEYSVSVDGLRQDFLLAQRPAGTAPLRLELAVDGAEAQAAAYGARLRLTDGRRLAYAKLQVEDAQGTVLPARMEVAATDRIALVIDDARAVYPLRIDPTFSDDQWISMGAVAGPNGSIEAVVVDAGGDLYIGGAFTAIGDQTINRIARWDGTTWHALGSGGGNGVDGTVIALAVMGSDLYVGGGFISATDAGGTKTVNSIARWDGTAWHALGAGGGNGVNGPVHALAVMGSDLYVGGDFTSATDAGGTKTAYYIARWDGTTWHALGGGGGNGVGSPVFALAVMGSDLYVGGWFYTATDAGGTKTVNNIARWDGTMWHALGGGGGNGVDGPVTALAAMGSDLYVAGWFNSATDAGGTKLVNNITRWDGTTWHALGSGGGNGMNDMVWALAVMGSDLYVGGLFTSATDAGGTKTVHRIARWDGTTWHALGGGGGNGVNGQVSALAVMGSDLYVGGWFTSATDAGGAKPVNRIARWDGMTWRALGSGVNSRVNALAVMGSDLYVGGSFTSASDAGGTKPVNYIARWDGMTWHALGSGGGNGVSGEVRALAVMGSDLYVGGDFSSATDAGGTKTAYYIARWDGTTWHALGSGGGNGVNGSVFALAVMGSDLYVGGVFSSATDAGGTKTVNGIARWDGMTWHALGGGGGNGVSGSVYALAVMGSDLYVGGWFTSATDAGGTTPVNNIARWDGTTWHALGSGGGNGVNGVVYALAVMGSELYVGGWFTSATDAGGTTLVNHIARWDGTTWHALGGGGGNGVNDTVVALAVAGSDLYVGGGFTSAADAGGTTPVNRIARWDGGTWLPLGSGMNGAVLALAVDNNGQLYAGGVFTTAGDKASTYLAQADLRVSLAYAGNGATSGAAPAGSGLVSPGTALSVAGNTGGLSRTGYSFSGWNTQADGAGVSYAPGDTLTLGGNDVTLYAVWQLNSYTVSASAGPGGAISPTSRSVVHGEHASFSLLPQPGYVVVAASGCGGSLMGLNYTTGPITAPCTVSASFGPAQYAVEASAGAGGRISPAHQWVNHGGSASFSVTPDSGFSIALVSGCNGSLDGNTYTTGAITSPCSVLASFSRDRYPVSTQASAGGRLSPESQLVDHGARASFSVTVDDGYRLVGVSGCGGALSDDSYTTGPITGACTVSATFASDAPAFGVIEPVRLDATGLFTPLPELVVPEAHDRHGNPLTPTLLGAKSHYAPGRHTLTWRAEDAEGRVATAEQRLDVWPQVSLSQDLRLGYNASGSFQILLNGPAPEYPLTVSYGVGGSAQVGVDHALAAGSVTFTGGTALSVPLQTLAGSGVDTELVVSLEPGVNRGARQQLVATLVTGNAAPRVELRAWQGGRPVVAVARDGGPVSLVATVTDPNPQDTHQGEWRVPADAVVSTGPNGLSLGIDPLSLGVGLLAFELTVTDSGTPAAVTVVSLPLNVIESAPALGGGDSNGNGIPDNVEGDGDSNGNGIPDYQEGGLAPNLLPSEGGVFDRFLLEAEPGLRLGLGVYAIGQELGGSRLVHPEALPQADSVTSAGGYFDFLVSGLPEPGRSVRVVLPQQAPVPAGAVYRKYSPSRGEWFDFVEDGRNGLASAPGDQGYCPPPGDMSYSPGLTEGHWCVQLTLEDGGPNDADGVANGEVRDPGGVAVAAAEEPVPERRGGGGGADLALLVLGLLWMAGLRHRRVG